MARALIIIGLLMIAAAVALEASAADEVACTLRVETQRLEITNERLRAGASSPALDDVERRLLSTSCDGGAASGLTLTSVDLGLHVRDWQRGARRLEEGRLGRIGLGDGHVQVPSIDLMTAIGRRSSQ